MAKRKRRITLLEIKNALPDSYDTLSLYTAKYKVPVNSNMIRTVTLGNYETNDPDVLMAVREAYMKSAEKWLPSMVAAIEEYFDYTYGGEG